jgi:hypothetical protein
MFQFGRQCMNDSGGNSLINSDAAPTEKFKQRLMPICYFSAIAIAMVGWLIGDWLGSPRNCELVLI